MEVEYTIVYEKSVVLEDIQRLSKQVRKRLQITVLTKLSTAPESYGKPLRYSLKGHYTLRVGAYRVIYRVDNKTVRVFGVLHRERSYKEVVKRLAK